MKIARVCAANCFFAFMLFNAAASGLAQEPGRSIKPASEIRPDNNPKMETKKIGLAIHGSAGTNEMDASIMDGKTLKAGAVGSVQHIKNPINLARLVMEKSPHVMLDCAGAEAFAKANGIELVDQKYFFTQQRWDALQKMKAAEKNKTSGAGKSF